jgi:TIR domain-containing protein
MADIFISYAHKDLERVANISRALADLDVSVWSDQKIRAGEQWMTEIEKALTEAKVLVLCVSPSFLASDWAQFEIGVALSRSRDAGVKVIPILLNDSIVPEALNRFQFIDARRLSTDQVAAEIQKAVEASRE